MALGVGRCQLARGLSLSGGQSPPSSQSERRDPAA